MLRLYTWFLCAALLLAVGFAPIAPTPAAGDTPATFTPEMTPAPSPTALVTALPPPFTRPEDARGISQTTPPLQAPSPFRAPTPPPVLWLSNASSFSIPCSVHARRVFVPAVVGGKPKTFVLGSGSLFSQVDAESAAPSRDDPITLPTVQLGELRFNGLAAVVSRVGPFAQTYLGAPADGVLGQELFARFPVKIDYRGCTVTIFHDSAAAQADAMRAETTRGDAANAARSLALRMIGGLPALEAKIGSTSLLVAADTASDADVDVTQAFVTSSRLPIAGPTVRELRRAQPDGEIPGRTARVRTLSLGTLSIDAALLGVLTGPTHLPSGVVGILGEGVLDRFVVLFDEPGGMLVLTPQPAAPQSYDRGGLWLIERQNAIAIRSVLSGAPADRAGLRAGDLILAVNGQAVSDLDAARALFAGPVGTKLAITFMRRGAQRSTSLTLKTILQ